MRKLLVSLACLAAAVPTVALAADNSNGDGGGKPHPNELRIDAADKAKHGRYALAKRHRRAIEPKHRRMAAKRQGAGAGTSPALQAIAACESGGNPSAIGGGGSFRGKYQFDRGTWASVGGSGDPAAAPEAEQDKRAAMLYARSGAAPWPVCGR